MAKFPEMPRDRQSQLLRMAEALQAAAASAEWDKLGQQASALGPQLQALAALGPWNAAERAALHCLRTQHDVAADAAAGAGRTLGARLEEMRANHEGWVAYAMHSPIEPGSTQP